MEWQPIETAPKDGTIILAADGRQVVAAYWNMAPKAFGADHAYPWTFLDETNGTNGLMDGFLTHWMPLPASPTPTDGDTR